MIFKIKQSGASAMSNLVDYVLRINGEKHVGETINVIHMQHLVGNSQDIKGQFKMAFNLNNHKTQTPLLHVMCSLSKGETLNENQYLALMDKIVNEFKLEKNQLLMVEHAHKTDLDYKCHVHFIINRTTIDGSKSANTFQSKKRLMNIARSCEQEWGLKPIPLTNERKENLKFAIEKSLIGEHSFDTFEAKMKALGYTVLKGRGITFVDDKLVHTKGSSVDYSLKNIEKILTYNAGLKDHLTEKKDDLKHLQNKIDRMDFKEIILKITIQINLLLRK